MFTPEPLKGRAFFVSPETQARTARAERMFVHMESKAQEGAMGVALRRALARLEAISTIRIEGKRPRVKAILFLESVLDERTALTDEKLQSTDAFDYEGANDREVAVEVVRYVQALEHIYRGDGARPFGVEELLDIHSIVLYGKPANETGSTLRRSPFRLDSEVGAKAYAPPSPQRIPALVEDLCMFINRQEYAPTAQSAIAHFQFESIKPFKSGMDKTGRLMCHAVLHRQGLARSIIAPIGLEPAIDTKSHAELLMPYHFGKSVDGQNLGKHLNRWIEFCAWSEEVSIRTADAFLDAMLRLKDAWYEELGRPNKGSAAMALLTLLPGVPVLTASQAARLSGKSVTAVHDAFARLEAAGIVEVVETSQRNRVFSAPRAVALFEELVNKLVPNDPVARNSFVPSFFIS